GYVDIDNFKAFNDRYGFARGDDLIRMTGRLLINVIRRLSPKKSFVGHIGGDDFFFITESGLVHESCNQIIQNFDLISSTFANDEDRAKGYIECEDRSGKIRQFPLPTISIAVIDSAVTEISHPGEASSIASEIKKEVKKISGSNFMINRRKRFRKDAG
ncbi:MAG: diguanylate cyclase, partial [Candidatus Aureabacteria bacterium]|nr:diguanylate cyclase [Candidatus Auribacterota bacterium]